MLETVSPDVRPNHRAGTERLPGPLLRYRGCRRDRQRPSPGHEPRGLGEPTVRALRIHEQRDRGRGGRDLADQLGGSWCDLRQELSRDGRGRCEDDGVGREVVAVVGRHAVGASFLTSELDHGGAEAERAGFERLG